MRHLSVATRLAVAVILVSATAVAATSILGLRSGERAAERLVEQQIVSLRGAERLQVAAHLESTRSLVGLLADSPMSATALQRFTSGFVELETPDRPTVSSWRHELLDHYTTAVAPELSETTGRVVSPTSLLPGTDRGVALQRAFLRAVTGRDPIDVVEPELWPDGPDGADVDEDGVGGADETWAEAHRELHPVFRDVALRLGAEELSLVDRAGNVVYSVAKSPDFATNVFVGPHSGRSLGVAARRAATAARGDVQVVDVSSYPPALGRPVWFMVAPVFTDEGSVGSLAVRFSVDPLNEMLTTGEPNPTDTAEAYLVGADGRLRSDPRAYLESPTAYLAEARAAGMSDADADLVAARSTTVLVQRADGGVVHEALAGSASVHHRLDHLGREAVMTSAPLGVAGVDWVIVAQITSEEAHGPIDEYRRLLLMVATVIVAVVTFGAVAWAGRAVRPVRLMGERLAAPGGGHDAAPGSAEVRTDELARLADALATMEAQLVVRRGEVERAEAERRSILRSLVPPVIARRLDVGAGQLVERPDSASVIVVVVGWSDPTHGPMDRSSAAREELDASLARIDDAAARHDVERIKLVGDACFLATGHQQLLLDHARRAVSFALDVRDAFASADDVAVSFGIATGPVNVGLAGSTQLVYDVWGSTVSEAYLLARQAAPGTVLLTDATHDHLPAEVAVSAVAGPSGQVWTVRSVPASASGEART